MNSSSKPLRFGLVGIGTHGRQAVIPSFTRAPSCDLVAVADCDQAQLDSVADESLRRYLSLEAMLAKETLDVIYIATLPSTHCELALGALAYGAHVICEKPLAVDADEAARMVEAAELAGKQLLVMFENRMLPAYRKIKSWVESGVIGRVEAIHLQRFGKHPLAQPRRTHLLNAAGSLDCGIHTLDLVRFWMGGASWGVIHALGAWLGEEVENPPHIGVLSRLDNGVMVTFDCSFSYGLRVDRVDYRFKKESLAIVGTHGVIRDYGDHLDGFEVISDELVEKMSFVQVPHRDEIGKVLEHFASVLRGGADPENLLASGHDGLEAQRAVDEINLQARNTRLESTLLAMS